MAKDFYSILGVDKSASPEAIKKAYRALAHQYHPDKQGGSEEKFKEINEAYQTLSDERKRAQYDQFGQTFNQTGGGGFNDFGGFGGQGSYGAGVNFEDLGDIFSSFFGGARGADTQQYRGSDLEMQTTIEFAEAVRGQEVVLELTKELACERCTGSGAEPGSKLETCRTCAGQGRVQTTRQTILGSFAQVTTCPKCKGRGKLPEKPCSKCAGDGRVRGSEKLKVHIPAGIDDGQVIRVPGKGDAPAAGGTPGDLFLRVRVKSDDRFERRGSDVYTAMPVTFAQAALGAEIVVETVDGKVRVDVPAGTQNGKILALRGKGIPKLGSPTQRGTHYIEITVVVPKKLSPRQRKLIEELSTEDPKNLKMPKEGLFSRLKNHLH